MKKAARFASALAAGLLWLGASSTTNAAIVQFAATIDGAQETPPVASPALASGTFTMDTVADTLSINIVITTPPPSGEIAAHIHGFAPPGVPAGIVFGLPLGSPKIAVWNFLPAQEANIISGLAYVNIHSAAFPGGEIRGQILRVPSCGDGILDGGEACDDGNVVNGDCCDSFCQFEPLGSPCPGDDDACTVNQCDGAGACGIGAPQGGCRAALKSLLAIKKNDDDTKNKLLWKWLKGDATALADFANPIGSTTYTLCVYAGTASAFLGKADILPGASWEAVSDKGYKLSDPSGAPDGIQKANLTSGAEDKAKILVKGKGSNLPGLLSGVLPLPVTAQLVNDANAICYEGQYDAPDVKKNDGAQFKAKAQ